MIAGDVISIIYGDGIEATVGENKVINITVTYKTNSQDVYHIFYTDNTSENIYNVKSAKIHG